MDRNIDEMIPYVIRQNDTLWEIANRNNTTARAIFENNPGIDPNNLRVGHIIYIRPGLQPPARHERPPASGISRAELGLNNQMRMLWEQHGVWTRHAIDSIIFDLPDVDFVIRRLLRNPKDFEAALRPIYGSRAAMQFSNLLTEHLVIASQLVKEAKAGDAAAARETEKKWYANADQIAALLAEINPFWRQDTWRKLLHDHLALVKSQAVDLLNKNYAASINDYDKTEAEALMMADELTRGIIRQFPDRFA